MYNREFHFRVDKNPSRIIDDSSGTTSTFNLVEDSELGDVTCSSSSMQNSLAPSTSIISSVKIHSNKKRKVAISTSLESLITKTSVQQKHELDKQIAKVVFATNSSFRCIEHPEVKKATQLLRPG